LREVDVEAPSGHNQLTGTVRDASYLGVSTQYQIEARGGARLTVFEQNVERATRSELWAPGENVQLTWSPDHCFVIVETESAAAGSPTDPPTDAQPPEEIQ
jgi:spermidine/putrescine transport system ATP-binding protein